ncbi:MAG: Fic family protein [Candidatus Uhrbacteria bacterium]|nr:Fic family protein [Candidatus Uhrbacteria bacterium]
MALESRILARIEEKKKRLDALRPLPVSAVKKLQEQFKIEMTYNSNGIEGNTLTLYETFLVIREGITIKGKPLKDHLEAKDHYEALEYLYGLVGKDSRQTVSEQLIRNLHKLVTHTVDVEWAGRYREGNVAITGAKHTPPDMLDVPLKMRELIQWYRSHAGKLHTIELAAIIHHQLVYIHPFFDGNGRTSRLLMNVLLMQSGYPLAVVLKNDRKKYYRVLELADGGKNDPLVRFVAQAVERSLNIYLKTLEPTATRTGRYLPLENLARSTPYSAKYLNLLARQGKIEAHKDGRNWVATRDALERYIASRLRKRGAR